MVKGLPVNQGARGEGISTSPLAETFEIFSRFFCDMAQGGCRCILKIRTEKTVKGLNCELAILA